jgi:hypothetical protein
MGKIIEGRFSRPFSQRVEMIDAQATATRLMGVVGIVARWRIDGSETIYQLIHLDYEDYGIDACDEYNASETDRIEQRVIEMTGGLGGAFRPVNYAEYAYLVASAHVVDPESPNAVYDFLPKYDFVIRDYEANGLGRELTMALFERLGPEPLSDSEHLHYYMMRLHGQDAEGTLYLGDLVLDERLDGPKSTLLKNTVKIGPEPDHYRVEALIENELGYYVRIFDVAFQNDLPAHPKRWVTSCELRHELAVSPIEASFMLRKTEYIALYSVLEPTFLLEFEKRMPELMANSYESGDLFTEFNRDNAHVSEWVYYLNGDVYANYYITNSNQLIVAAFSHDIIEQIDHRFETGNLSQLLSKIGDFSADQPLLYDFINSGLTDFFDYL